VGSGIETDEPAFGGAGTLGPTQNLNWDLNFF
jgi:hypothetical protein